MKVYVVEDENILLVFSTLELANEFINSCPEFLDLRVTERNVETDLKFLNRG